MGSALSIESENEKIMLAVKPFWRQDIDPTITATV